MKKLIKANKVPMFYGVKSQQELYKKGVIGDILFSRMGLPDGGVLFRLKKEDELELLLDGLKTYLSFLELIVLNERILIADSPSFATLVTFEEFLNADIEDYLVHANEAYYLRPELELIKDLEKKTENKGIMVNVIVNNNELLSPMELALKYVNIDDKCADEYRQLKGLAKSYGFGNELADRLAFTVLATGYGSTLYLSEFCRSAKVPYHLHRIQAESISSHEEMENMLRKQVIGNIKYRLDTGAKKELMKMKELGIEYIFPTSPIASTIIMESNKPEDLNLVALQLREEYCDLRKQLNTFQAEVLREDISLDKKLKIYKHINSICSELWKERAAGWQTVLHTITGFLSIIGEVATSPSIRNINDAIEYFSFKPIEAIKRALLRRKMKVILKSKDNFLKSANWTSKLSSIFGISVESVKRAQLKDNG